MSIIGNAIMLGGGGGFATVTLVAPKGSTISWTGADTGTATLNSNETYTIVTLAKGIYVFTNTLTYSLNGGSRTDNIWTKTVDVTGAMTINVYPDGAIWWYGLLNETFASADGGGISIAENGVAVQSVNSQLHTGMRSVNEFDVTGKTAIKSRCFFAGSIQTTTNSQTQPRLWKTSDSDSPWKDTNNNCSSVAVFGMREYTALINETGNYSVGMRAGRSSGDYYNKYIYLYALWLE